MRIEANKREIERVIKGEFENTSNNKEYKDEEILRQKAISDILEKEAQEETKKLELTIENLKSKNEELESEIEMFQTDAQEWEDKYKELLKQMQNLHRVLKNQQDETNNVGEDEENSKK